MYVILCLTSWHGLRAKVWPDASSKLPNIQNFMKFPRKLKCHEQLETSQLRHHPHAPGEPDGRLPSYVGKSAWPALFFLVVPSLLLLDADDCHSSMRLILSGG